jgi:hypothetical protein
MVLSVWINNFVRFLDALKIIKIFNSKNVMKNLKNVFITTI